MKQVPIYDNNRQVKAKWKEKYAGMFPKLVLINATYRSKKDKPPAELPGLALANLLAGRGRCVVVYGLPAIIPESCQAMVERLRQMQNVRFLDNPDEPRTLYQADNELRAPWLPHNCLGNPRATRTTPKTRD